MPAEVSLEPENVLGLELARLGVGRGDACGLRLALAVHVEDLAVEDVVHHLMRDAISMQSACNHAIIAQIWLWKMWSITSCSMTVLQLCTTITSWKCFFEFWSERVSWSR